MLNEEFVQLLTGYLSNRNKAEELVGWIVGYDWDDGDPERSFERMVLGHLRLIATDVLEGVEEETELRAAVQAVLASLQGAGVTQVLLSDSPTPHGTSVDVYSVASASVDEMRYEEDVAVRDERVSSEVYLLGPESLDGEIRETSDTQPSVVRVAG